MNGYWAAAISWNVLLERRRYEYNGNIQVRNAAGRLSA